MPQERDYLTRSSEAYQQALDLYTQIASFSGVPGSVRKTQAGLERVKNRMGDIEGSHFSIDLGPLGNVTFQKNADEPGADHGAKGAGGANDSGDSGDAGDTPQ
jgi:hypothetical protein